MADGNNSGCYDARQPADRLVAMVSLAWVQDIPRGTGGHRVSLMSVFSSRWKWRNLPNLGLGEIMNTFFGQSAVAGPAGRRSRVRRWAAMLVIAPTSAYLLLMTSSLLGGPTFNSPLLPNAAGQAPTEPEAGLLPVGPGGDTSVRMEGMPPTPGGADESTAVGPGDPALDVELPDVVVPAGTANRGAPTVGQQQTGSTGTASAGKTQPKTGTQTEQTTTSKSGTTTTSKPAAKPTEPATSQPTQPAEPPAEPPSAEEPTDPPAASGPLEPVVEILTPVVDPVVDLLEGVGGLLDP